MHEFIHMCILSGFTLSAVVEVIMEVDWAVLFVVVATKMIQE